MWKRFVGLPTSNEDITIYGGLVMHEPISISEIKKRLLEQYGALVKIDESTYRNTHSKARFIDSEYGEWWAIVKDVLSGHRSRKRMAAILKGKRPKFTDEGFKKITGRPPKWDKEALLTDAKKYQTVKAWKQSSPSAYNAAWYQGKLIECTKHMIRPKRKYTKKELVRIAKEYETRTKFNKGHPGVYAAAVKMGVLDEICVHMQSGHNQNLKDITKSVYLIQFSDGSSYVGLSSNPTKRYLEHMESNGVVSRHSETLGREQPVLRVVSKNLNSLQAAKKEAELISRLKSEGRNVLNKAKAGSIGSQKEYTKKELIAIAKRYRSKSEFHSNHGGAYNAAKRLNILEECCQHMKVKKRRWTLESAIAEGKKFCSRSQWQRAENRSYVIVRDAGMLDDVMPSKMIAWDERSVLIEKEKYKTHGEWSKQSPGSYNYWKKNIKKRSDER